MLVASLSSLTIGSLLGVFFNMPLFDNIVSAGLAILFAFYISYDTQMIVGGRHHKYAYSQKEYILAALNLYQDLINMFLEIVKLLARNKRHTKHDRDR
jgi:FtsH-binding integral membrane protein